MALVDWIGQWIVTWPGAVLLQRSGTAYLLVNAAHILGLGLLVGAILPLDLRLLGFFRGVPLAVIGPFLSRAAATGLALAIATGLWLFSVKPAEYLANEAFLWKIALLAAALVNIVVQHRSGAFARALVEGEVRTGVRLAALCSAVLWLSVLVAGRWIGFV
ncbi:MAG: DUF2214 domain-containing protein [Reyranella sp.]|uniref:DUF6644 family protein n=1 Tax=Reyranella sp. TaxID=1929291 RepID=UPI00273190A9|nr:DUF6644 family protein [Reyranella sp.]MDP1961043.1 DUF2214 domain-containing protein [Reyranella sp.]MDP2372156.1 DUF2214 domain-containing protein [Reyranella sp.]